MMPRPTVKRNRPTRARSARAAAVMALLALAACGAPVARAEAAGVAVRIAYFNNYLPSELEAQVLARLAARAPALGVGSATLVGSDVTPAWVGLSRGDTDVLVEVDLPNQQPLVDKAAAVAELAGQIYADAGEGLFVPRYVVEGPGAPAAGLKRIDQLGSYATLFGGTLYDEAPGWQTTRYNALRLAAYRIPLRQMPLADAALIATVTRAIERRQPIVFFFYHPHWLFRSTALARLEEPVAYHAGCFQGGDDRCAVPSFSASIAARKDLAARAPRFRKLLAQVRIPIDDVEQMMYEVSVGKHPARDVAAGWVDSHGAVVDGWIRAAGGG